MRLNVGDVAPNFQLVSTKSNDKLELANFKSKKNVLVAFYPLDFTPG
jgi:peroxiredoxin